MKSAQFVAAFLLASLHLTSSLLAGPQGTILVRELDTVTIDGDTSDWPLENFEAVLELPDAPAGLEAESLDAQGDYLVYDIDKVGFFNGTEKPHLTDGGAGDFGASTYFAYDTEFFYILSVVVDEMVRGDRDASETGSQGFLNDGFEFFIDAAGDSDDCVAMGATFEDADPNRDDMQITVAINDNFLPEGAEADQLGARQGIERGGNPLLVSAEGGEKNGPGGLLRDALDALDGPDIAARKTEDGYVIEQRIPFGFIPEFTPDNVMKYTHFWNDFDTDDGPGGANKSWVTWGQQSTVTCTEDEDPPIGLFHAATWAAMEFVTDNPLNNQPGPNISLRTKKDFGQLDIPPTEHELTIPVRNTGISNPLAITNITVSGADADRFSVVSFPNTLEPKAGGDIVLSFDSQGITGPYEATLEVTNDDVDAEDQTRQVSLKIGVVDPAGPFAHLKLDETDGTTLGDSSGNGRGGTLEPGGGSATLNQDPLAGGRAVAVADGGSVRLEGKPFGLLGSFSVSLWFQAADTAGQGTLVSRGTGGSPVFAVLQSGNNASFFVNDGPIFASEGDLISAGTAHHLVATYDSTRAAIFIDGVEAGTLDNPDPLDDFEEEPFWLGSFAQALGFAGSIDDFQYYNRVLSPEEIQTLKDNPGEALRGVTPGGGGAEGGLEGYWAFDEGTGTAAEDSTSVGRPAMVRNGAPTWTEGRTGGALSFDGDDDLTVTGWKGISGANPRSISYWMKTDWGVDVPSGTVGWGTSTTGLKWHTRLNENANNGPVGAIRTEIQGSFHIGTKVINDGEWHHVVSVFPEGGQFMQDLVHYVDGELQEVGGTGSTTVEVDTDPNGEEVTFGSRLQGAAQQFYIGDLDDVSIWSRALTAEEVLALSKGATPTDVAAGNLEIPGPPKTELDLLVLGADDTGETGADANVLAFLGERFTSVRYMNSSATNGSETADVIIMSSTFGSGSVRGKFHNAAVPILNWEEAIMDSGDGEFGQSLPTMTKSTDTTQMALGDHPIAGSLAGTTIDFLTAAGAETLGSSELSAGTVAVGNGVGGAVDGFAMLFVTDTGGAVGEGSGVNGGISPARRVAFPMTDATFDSLTDHGKTLLVNAILWAAGVIDPPVLPDIPGVIGYWPLDGSAVDVSGQGADGNVVNPDGVWIENGGRAAYQSGNGSFIELVTLPVIGLDTDFTWSFWVNADETDNNNIVFGNRWAPDGVDFAPREFIKFTPRVFEWHVDGGGQNVPGDNTMFVIGEWTHNLVVKSGTTLTYYRNGAEIASSEITSAPTNAQPLYLGGQDGRENFAGKFDEVAIFNRALSADEVTDVYNRGLNGQALTGPVEGPGPHLILTNVGIQASGAFGITIPNGATADIEYSTDLLNWEVIATGVSGAIEETDADRLAAPAGFYRARP